ncbi:MAG: MFS transporter [Rhodospirillaceae bacterium]|jgi:fucose permease|nr:MFS transporter [Rhodospirillaceae bacterium]
MPILLIAIVAMLVQQTIASAAKVGLPALFPALAEELNFDAEYVLVYTWIYAVVGVVVMMGCGGAIRRWGALRTSQAGCVLMAAGLSTAAILANPWFVVPALGLAAILNSTGTMVATPASSQILARYAPPKWAPLVFSIKQTGVPAGIAIAGIILAPLAVTYGWRAAALGLAGVCLVVGLLLQPMRAEFDQDRDPNARPHARDFTSSVREVLAKWELRGLALGCFTFVGMQTLFTDFTITYLHETLNYDLATAGATLGIATLMAVPARIFWGWIGSTVIKPRHLLAGMALIMAISTTAMGAFDESWSQHAVLAVTAAVSLSVLSWHGVLLSETARLAPAGEAGRVTGGVLAFGAAGQIVFPLLFGLGHLVGGYAVAFAAIGAPAILVGLVLLMPDRTPASGST